MSKIRILLVLISITIFTLLLFTKGSFAESITLEELLKEAKANNPGLKAFQEKIKAKEARAGVEGRLEDPTLKVEMEDLSKSRPFNISPSEAMLTRYTFSQAFPFPGKLSLKEKIALKEAIMARAEFNARELEIEDMVKEAYFEYAFLNESIRITNDVKDLLSNMSSVARARYSTGLVPQQDVLKVQVESSMLANDIVEPCGGIAQGRRFPEGYGHDARLHHRRDRRRGRNGQDTEAR